MGRVPTAVTMLLAVVAGAVAEAQVVTEEIFLQDALINHPGLSAAAAAAAAAVGARQQAGMFANPDLAWELEDPDQSARQSTWRLSWRLPVDGRRHRIAAADAAVAAATADVETERVQLRRELRALFAAWYIASEREVVLRQQLEETGRLAARVRARVEHGEASGVEAWRLGLEVEILSHRLAVACAATGAGRAATAAWSALVGEGATPARPRLAHPPTSVDVEARPDVAARAHHVAEAAAAQRLAGQVLAAPEVSVGWLELREPSASLDGAVFGVAWSLPLFDRNQAARSVAEAEEASARAELELARRRAEEQAEMALTSFSRLFRAVSAERPPAAAGDVIDSVRAAFDAGEASLTDLLDALRTTTEVRLTRLETLAAALEAQRELEAAMGAPLIPGGAS